MTRQFSLLVDSQPKRLAEISDFIRHAAQTSGLKEDQIYEVQMAVDEASANIIEHAYHGRKNGTLDLVCERRDREFVVTIRDHGDPFDPTKVPRPHTSDPLSRRNIGGLGLFFMHKLMDRVEFQFSAQEGNLLTMVKKIKK